MRVKTQIKHGSAKFPTSFTKPPIQGGGLSCILNIQIITHKVNNSKNKIKIIQMQLMAHYNKEITLLHVRTIRNWILRDKLVGLDAGQTPAVYPAATILSKSTSLIPFSYMG
jgi:hypothetical protein